MNTQTPLQRVQKVSRWVRIFGFLLFGGMIVCISWIMETGKEMREDQELAI